MGTLCLNMDISAERSSWTALLHVHNMCLPCLTSTLETGIMKSTLANDLKSGKISPIKARQFYFLHTFNKVIQGLLHDLVVK